MITFLEKLGSFSIWRHIVNFWTVIFFLAVIYDFFTLNSLAKNDAILVIAAIYTASLAIYSAEKEFRRWKHAHNTMHPGEVYAFMWTVLVITLIIGDTFLMKEYHIPPEVTASYIAVIGILAITRESKNVYKKRKAQ